MLIVQTKPAEPAWVPVGGGAEVLFAPITRTAVLRARRAARDLSAAEPEDGDRPTVDLIEEIGDALSRVLILAGAQDWRGVISQQLDDAGEPVEGEDGQPVYVDLPFSRENLEAALADPFTFDAFDDAYVQPFAQRERAREAPGKDLPRSPDGTGTKAKEASAIARSRAPANAASAKRARTASTKRKAPRKRSSGKSRAPATAS